MASPRSLIANSLQTSPGSCRELLNDARAKLRAKVERAAVLSTFAAINQLRRRSTGISGVDPNATLRIRYTAPVKHIYVQVLIEAAAAAAARWNGIEPAPDEICWVVRETLRLWPPSWLVDRVTDASVECGAWTIPARSKLILPLWAIHRLADCYPDPERFDSRRWAALSPPPGTYLPYSSGPKWCLGERFADAELTTILMVLLRRIRVSLRGEVQPDARRTLTPTGFELLVEARS